MSAGLDSISATELARSLSEKAGVDVPTTLLFDHPTSADLVSFLGGSLCADLATDPVPRTGGPDAAAAVVLTDADSCEVASSQCATPADQHPGVKVRAAPIVRETTLGVANAKDTTEPTIAVRNQVGIKPATSSDYNQFAVPDNHSALSC
mmetsp:Transcript_3444/g.13317  ORF Transcript_3444/g.13317 Transcript_3444/m.13317 type:complete len:150 (-) Transcript_3444:1606-2055(-)